MIGLESKANLSRYFKDLHRAVSLQEDHDKLNWIQDVLQAVIEEAEAFKEDANSLCEAVSGPYILWQGMPDVIGKELKKRMDAHFELEKKYK